MRKIIFIVIIPLIGFFSASLVYGKLTEKEERDLVSDVAVIKERVKEIKKAVDEDLKPAIKLVPIIEIKLDHVIKQIENIGGSISSLEISLDVTGKDLREKSNKTTEGLANVQGQLSATNMWIGGFIIAVVVGIIAIFVQRFIPQRGKT